jgi:hypothetical protein
MLRTVPGPFWRHNLGLGAHELSKKQGVLIINGVNLVGAEIAGLFWQGLAVILVHYFFHGLQD